MSLPPSKEASKQTDDSASSTPYWERLRYELRPSTPMFSLQEPDGNVIDVANTFAAQPGALTATLRVILFIGTLAYIAYWWLVYFPATSSRWVYWAFFTHWVLLLNVLYQGLAAVLALWPRTFLVQPHSSASSPPTPHPLVCLTWILYNGLLPASLFTMLAYWTAMGGIQEHQAPMESIMDHGGFFFLLLLDGLVFHRIPVRLQHAALTYGLYLAYLVFYLIYDLTSDKGNGDYEWEPEDDKTSVYATLNFTTHRTMGIVTFTLVPVLVIPASMWLFWSLSLYSGRRVVARPCTTTVDDHDHSGSTSAEDFSESAMDVSWHADRQTTTSSQTSKVADNV